MSFQLRNGPDNHSPPLGPSGRNGRFCGMYAPSTLFTSGNEMFVQFISDSSNGGQGFKIRYEAKSLGKCFLENSICTPPPPGLFGLGILEKKTQSFLR